MCSTATTRDYISLSLRESTSLVECKHASHCMLYSRPDSTDSTTDLYGLLQLRFDGLIGFAGGEVDVIDLEVNDIIEATNRELEEEINYRFGSIGESDWICTHRDVGSPFVQHFFAKQITSEQFRHIEKTHTKAEHFPSESLGLFRVPIGGSANSRKFLNNFLRQKFAGNAKQQFIETIKKLSLLSSSDQKWIESNDFVDESCDSIATEVKAMLRTELKLNYYHQFDVSYGLMIVRNNGFFDFIGTDYIDGNDKNLIIETLTKNLKKDLGFDSVPIDREMSEIDLSFDNNSSHVFDLQLNSNQFTEIEATFTESENFKNDISFGIFRIPFQFKGRTAEAESYANKYVNRFYNNFFTQRFVNNSKTHLKYIFDNTFKYN